MCERQQAYVEIEKPITLIVKKVCDIHLQLTTYCSINFPFHYRIIQHIRKTIMTYGVLFKWKANFAVPEKMVKVRICNHPFKFISNFSHSSYTRKFSYYTRVVEFSNNQNFDH